MLSLCSVKNWNWEKGAHDTLIMPPLPSDTVMPTYFFYRLYEWVRASFLKTFKCIYIFTYFWLCWVFIAMRGLSLLVANGGYSPVALLGLLIAVASLVALGCMGFSSCSTQALLVQGMWTLPGPGIEPASPALADRFLTTGPPGKSIDCFKIYLFIWLHQVLAVTCRVFSLCYGMRDL